MTLDTSIAVSKPIILIVPGSASPAAMYSDMIEHLVSSGYKSLVHDLPSASRAPPQAPASLADDAAVFQDKIQTLADAGKDVVMVAHSYGGLVATDAARNLGKAERMEKGLKGGIIRIVYLTCLVGAVGEGSSDICSELDFDFLEPADEKNEFMRQIPEKSAPNVFSDLPLEEGLKWVGRMSLQSARSFGDKSVHPAYCYIPVSYILCTKDAVLTPKFQQERVDFLELESGMKVDVLRLDGGHCPNASMPEQTARLISDAIEGNA